MSKLIGTITPSATLTGQLSAEASICGSIHSQLLYYPATTRIEVVKHARKAKDEPTGLMHIVYDAAMPVDAIYLQVCTRNRGNAYRWHHPANYDSVDKADRKYGYGNLAEKRYGDLELYYDEVPEWMPNDGFLQTEFPVADKRGKLTLDLTTYLLPMLKPTYRMGGLSWIDCATMGQAQTRSTPIRFALMSGEQCVACSNIVKIGIRNFFGRYERAPIWEVSPEDGDDVRLSSKRLFTCYA